MRYFLWIFILIFFTTENIPAQEYYYRTYTVYDGLPSQEIYDIAQDSLGHMWFATRRGVVVYDGFALHRLDTLSSLTPMQLTRFCFDPQGNPWLTGYSPFTMLLHSDGKTWHKYITQPLIENYASTRPIFIKAVRTKNHHPSVMVVTANNHVLLFRDGRFTLWKPSSSPFGKKILSLQATSQNFYILGSKGIFKVTRDTVQKVNWPHMPKRAVLRSFYISRTSEQNRWILTTTAIYHFEGEKVRVIPLSREITRLILRNRVHLLPDYAGGVFLYGRKFLFHFNAFLNQWQPVLLSGKKVTGGINSLFMDREKNIWIATTRGVLKIPSLRFLNFHLASGLLKNEVTTIREFRPGLFFLGHENGFSIFDGKKFATHSFSADEAKVPLRILNSIALNGNIYGIVDRLGLLQIRPDGTYQLFRLPHAEYARALALSPQNEIIIATNKFLRTLQDGRLIPYRKNLRLDSIFIRKICFTPDQSIFLGGREAIIRIAKNSEVQVYRPKTKNRLFEIFSMLVDTNRIFVGTLDGLFEWQNGVFRRSPLFKEEIPVYAILRGNGGDMWLGTEQGVYKINRFLPPVHFDIRHGLAGMECNRDALYEDSQGRILIGTSDGLSLYQPTYDVAAPKPLLRFTHLNNSKLTYHITEKSNGLVFTFDCISFKDERNISLKYRLKGFEGWHYVPKLFTNHLSYLNLPSGAYQLQVQGRNVEGTWSEVVASPSIYIPLPLWRRWYFILAAIILLVLFFYFLVFTHQKVQINNLLEKEIVQRTKALQESEKKYRQLFMDSLDGIFITTPEGRFIDVNPAGVRLFGYESKEELMAVDIPSTLYLNPEDRERFKKEIAEKGHVQNLELNFRRKDGKIITAVLSSTCEYDDQGKIVAYRGYIRDITRWKEMEQQLAHSQRMESLGLLAGGIAHDFNNILAGILGYASLLKMKLSPHDKLYRFAEIIEKSAQRAAELTNQLLIFSRKGQSKLVEVNLNEVISESLKIIKPTFPKGIELKIDVDEDIPPIVADPMQLQQIIINLAVNARDAIPEGEGTITIVARQVEITNLQNFTTPDAKRGRYLCLCISDTGTGIPDEIKQKIFEPFFSTKPKGKGTGMGLAMVYGAVRNFGGFIQVESQLNKGTTFEIYLPVKTSQSTKKSLQNEQLHLKGNEKILVVDDEEMVRTFCQISLSAYGYKVYTAENGQKALEILQQKNQDFDLIILDMIMPVMGGFQAYQAIRKINPEIKFLISSGFSDSDKMALIKKDHRVDILFKPYKAEELAKKVRQILDKA